MTPTSKIGACFAVCTTIDTVGILGPMGPMGPMDLSKWAFLEARKIASNSYVSQGSHCCFSSESRVERLDGSGNQDLLVENTSVAICGEPLDSLDLIF